MRKIGSESSLIPSLGPRAWRLLAGQALSQIGTGMTFPILLVYLSRVRGMDMGTAGLVLASTSAAGLFTVLLAGAFTDRVGPGRALIMWLLVCGAGTGGFAFASRPVEAFTAAILYGMGVAGMWNAMATMFARVVAPEHRGSIFGVNYALQNLGFGLGATIGGLVLDIGRPLSFQLLFWADAASFLVFAALLVLTGELARLHDEAREDEGERQAGAEKRPPAGAKTDTGYRRVLRDRGLLACAGLNTLLSAIGFSQLNSAFPAWATGPAGVTPKVVGFAFLANTLVITLLQLLVMRYLLRGRRRTRAVAGTALLFGVAWVITLAAGWFPGGTAAAAALIVSLIIFGLGEMLLAPSLPALVNDLGPDHLRGRYNAVYSLSWQIGPIIGPAVAGFTLGHGLGAAHFTGLALACGIAAASAVWLERVIPRDANLGQSTTPEH